MSKQGYFNYDGPRLDDAAAKRGREDGVARAEASAKDAWRAKALEAVRQTAMQHEDFIVDQVWEHMDEKPAEARAMGAIMLNAAKQGLCVRTERFRQSAQPQCHSNPRRVWRSLLR